MQNAEEAIHEGEKESEGSERSEQPQADVVVPVHLITYLLFQARSGWAAGSTQPRAAVEMSSADVQNIRVHVGVDGWRPTAKLHENRLSDL